jgi:hypothetical protein
MSLMDEVAAILDRLPPEERRKIEIAAALHRGCGTPLRTRRKSLRFSLRPMSFSTAEAPAPERPTSASVLPSLVTSVRSSFAV